MAIKTIMDGLHVVPVGAVNVFLLDGPDGLTLIDAGFPNSADAILGAVRTLGRAPADLRTIVLTHAHPDHVGSAAAVMRATGAKATIHAADAPIARRGSGFRPMTPSPGLLNTVLFRLFVRLDTEVEPVSVEPTMADGDVLPIAGGLRVIHVPGHCAGQVALLWTGRGVLFAADACGNVMGLGPPLGYEDRPEGERSQRKLAALDFDVACFGHGKPITRNASAAFRKRFGTAAAPAGR